MDYKTFKKGIAILVKTFPEKDGDFEIMWEFLKDLPDDDFISAISKIIMTELDINKATNIIAMIRSYAIPENIIAGKAWGEVLSKISSVGSFGYPQFSDPLISEVVACIGWKSMCLSENIAIERAHFLKVYDSLAARKRNEKLVETHGIKKLISSGAKIKPIVYETNQDQQAKVSKLIKATLLKME